MTSLRRHILTLLIGMFGLAANSQAKMTPEQLSFFETKIRPVLAENCYSCHANSAKKLKAGLFLDHGSTILKGGDSGPAVVPGNLEKSLLIEAVRYKNPDLQMPPKKKLSDTAVRDLEKWVEDGAPWPNEPEPEKRLGPKSFDLQKRKSEHWCWQPVERAKAPQVNDRAWGKGAIDTFILAKLEAKGLRPAAPADRRTLIRRVSYDLIGMPPAVAEVEAFLSDTSPDAFERVVDRLLASPHFGASAGHATGWIWCAMPKPAGTSSTTRSTTRTSTATTSSAPSTPMFPTTSS